MVSGRVSVAMLSDTHTMVSGRLSVAMLSDTYLRDSGRLSGAMLSDTHKRSGRLSVAILSDTYLGALVASRPLAMFSDTHTSISVVMLSHTQKTLVASLSPCSLTLT